MFETLPRRLCDRDTYQFGFDMLAGDPLPRIC